MNTTKQKQKNAKITSTQKHKIKKHKIQKAQDTKTS